MALTELLMELGVWRSCSCWLQLQHPRAPLPLPSRHALFSLGPSAHHSLLPSGQARLAPVWASECLSSQSIFDPPVEVGALGRAQQSSLDERRWPQTPDL